MCDAVQCSAVDAVAAEAERSAVAALWRAAAVRKLASIPHGPDGYLALAPRLPLAEEEREIADDVHRSFSALPTGLRPVTDADRSAAEQTLSYVLRAWVSRSLVEGMGTGYVQGMGFVAALGVAVFGGGCEGDAFGLVCVMLEDVLTPSLYARWPPLAGCEAAAELVSDVCRRLFPPALVGADGVREVCVMLSVRWLLSAFVGVLPAAPLLRLWSSALCLADPCFAAAAAATTVATAERAGESPEREQVRRGTQLPDAPTGAARRRGSLPLMLLIRWAVEVITACAPAASEAALAGGPIPLAPAHLVYRHISASAGRMADSFDPPAPMRQLMEMLVRFDWKLREHRAALAEDSEDALPEVAGSEHALADHLTGHVAVHPECDYEDWVECLPAWGLGVAGGGIELLRRRVWRRVTGSLPVSSPPVAKTPSALSKLNTKLHGLRSRLRASPPRRRRDKGGELEPGGIEARLRRLEAFLEAGAGGGEAAAAAVPAPPPPPLRSVAALVAAAPELVNIRLLVAADTPPVVPLEALFA